MTYVISARGNESTKMVSGENRSVTPFMGCDREGSFAQMGIGLMYPALKRQVFWGLAMPHMVLRSWRGMKILEHVPQINFGTVCACWYAGGHTIGGDEQRYLDQLALEYGDMRAFYTMRAEVLATSPAHEVLIAMITLFREKKIDLEDWELKVEIKEGRIRTDPVIDTIIREADEWREEYRKEEAARAAAPKPPPLPPVKAPRSGFRRLFSRSA